MNPALQEPAAVCDARSRCVRPRATRPAPRRVSGRASRRVAGYGALRCRNARPRHRISRRLRQPPRVSHRMVVCHRLAQHARRRNAGLSDHVLSHETCDRRGQPERLRASPAIDRALRLERPQARPALAGPENPPRRTWAGGSRARRHRLSGSIAGRSNATRGVYTAAIDAEDFSLHLALEERSRRCSTAMRA